MPTSLPLVSARGKRPSVPPFTEGRVLRTDLNALFIHVTKNASSSMAIALGGGGPTNIEYYYNFVENHTELDWNSIFKFAFCRDPWDRFISSAFYSDRKGIPDLDKRLDRHLEMNVEGKTHAQLIDEYSQAGLFQPQYLYTHFGEKKETMLQIGGRKGIYTDLDFIGRFENIEKDWAYVCERLGVDIPLPHKNKGNHRPSEYYWTPEREAKVKKIYNVDYEVFNYE